MIQPSREPKAAFQANGCAPVAQVSNLLFADFRVGMPMRNSCGGRPFVTSGGLETRDTADWKSALRRSPVAVRRCAYAGGFLHLLTCKPNPKTVASTVCGTNCKQMGSRMRR